MRRGFTLVELLIVVAMVGVLATLAIVGYTKYIRAAGTAEVKSVIQGIRVAEESYKSETYQYKDCSASLTDYYPAAPNGLKHAWATAKGDAAEQCWRELNVVTDGPVQFGYAVKAGIGTTVITPGCNCKNWGPAHAAVNGPWFVVQAAGDQDKDGIKSCFASSSITSQICFDEAIGDDE